MKKVFVDVGAHYGESLGPAIDPQFGFDRIVCFEPAPECLEFLLCFEDPRVEVYAFGLWSQTVDKVLFGSGGVGASIFSDKETTQHSYGKRVCHFVRASDWFRDNLCESDVVYLKLNCEGCECDLLEDLISTNEIRKVKYLLVAFDVRKIPSQRHREFEIRQILKNQKQLLFLDYDDRDLRNFVWFHDRKIHLWLEVTSSSSSISERISFTLLLLKKLRLPSLLLKLANKAAPAIRGLLPSWAYSKFQGVWRSIRPGPSEFERKSNPYRSE